MLEQLGSRHVIITLLASLSVRTLQLPSLSVRTRQLQACRSYAKCTYSTNLRDAEKAGRAQAAAERWRRNVLARVLAPIFFLPTLPPSLCA